VLQHGLLDSSFGWMMNDKKESLAFILADLGYDVWITNNRGNRYSQEHTRYGFFEKGNKFWDFTWDDLAKFDLPANIEYIKKASGQEKVIYIGHSQGTTQMFAHLCTNPEFQENLKCFVGLGPVAKVGNQVKIINLL
jgi:lysosomal acid lipase/cholesteryl ester hydrolase